MATVRCRTCGETFSSSQSKCPNCGTRRAKGGRHAAQSSGGKAPIIILVIILVLALLAAVYFIFIKGSGDKDKGGRDDHSVNVSGSDISASQGDVNTDVLPIQPDDSSAPQTPPTDLAIDYVVISEQEIVLNDSVTTAQLSAFVYPSEAQQYLEWTSEDATIATVDENGLVTAVAPGTVKIMATAGDQMASCVVRVEMSAPQVVLKLYTIYNRDFSGDMSISYGETVQMYVDVDGAKTSEGITWSSDKTGIATVDENGVVKGVGGGIAHITATYTNGQSVSCICRVG